MLVIQSQFYLLQARAVSGHSAASERQAQGAAGKWKELAAVSSQDRRASDHRSHTQNIDQAATELRSEHLDHPDHCCSDDHLPGETGLRAGASPFS